MPVATYAVGDEVTYCLPGSLETRTVIVTAKLDNVNADGLPGFHGVIVGDHDSRGDDVWGYDEQIVPPED
jgi:hypothetical protein